MAITACLLFSGLPYIAAGDDGEAGEGPAGYAAWWDYSWIYRKPLTLDNTLNPKALTDYAVLVNLSVSDLVAAGKLRSDLGDMRFADSDGTTLLKYWVEAGTNVWVKVPSIPASAKKTIYLYYGNPSATLVSEGGKVFEVFDQFDGNGLDTTTWTLTYPGKYTVADRVFSIAADGSRQPGKAIARTASMENFYAIRSRFKITGGYDPDERMGLSIKCGMGDGRGYNYVLRDFTGLDEISFLDDFVQWNSRAGNWQKNTWYVEEIYHDGSLVNGRLNDGAWQTQSWSGRSGYPALYYGSYDGTSAWDWALVRKCQPPEPKGTLGAEEYPFKFLSATVSSQAPNEREEVTVNVTFNNPTSNPISFELALYEGEERADASVLEKRPVTLGPNGDKLVQFTWTAEGGNTVLWVELDGSPLASFPMTVNWWPTLDYIPDQRFVQDQAVTLRFTARDKDGEALSWSEDCPLFNFTRTNATGAEAAFRPTNDDVGAYVVNVSVTDSHGCRAARRFNFTVENLNDPPWLEHIPDLIANEDRPFSYQVTAFDPDRKWGDRLVFSADSFLFEIDPVRGNFSFTPTNAQVGRYFIEITVTDNQSLSASRAFNLTVQNQNDPPAIDPIPPQVATQGKLWQAMATASDPDTSTPQGDRLRFSDDSPLFDINAESGLVSFTPANVHVGVHRCNITVADMAGSSASTPLVLTVLNLNDPPVLEAIPDQTATEEVPFELAARASDPDVLLKLDNLTFSDDSELFDIDPATGAISFTPSNAQVGRHTVKITVKDESGASASRSFTLTVVNVNDPPFGVAITSLSADAKYRENEPIWFNGTGSDEDAGDRLRFTWLDNGVELGTGKSIQAKLAPGEHRITLQVSDGTETVTAEMTIMVSKVTNEQVTVQNDWWLPLVIVVLAAAGAGGVFLVMRRRRREPDSPAEAVESPAVAAAAPSAAGTGAPAAVAGAAAGAAAKDSDGRARARKALNAAEDAMAGALESGADVSEASDDLDLARDFFKAGDYGEAGQYARDAEKALKAAAGDSGGPAALGKLSCPGCGEELNPEWGACPICGHKTR